MSVENISAEDKLSKAKSRLILDQPFFASLCCNMPISVDNNYPTMATNGKWIKYNEKFVDNMTTQETMFVLCHEIGHAMFGHMFRRGERDMRKWNIAGDYVINNVLVEDRVGTMPSQGLHDPALVERGGGTTDGVYNLLPESEGGDDGYAGTGIDICEDAGGSDAESSQAQAEMKIALAQAAQAAKMRGKLSAGVARLVDHALRPQVPWQDVLRRFINARAKVEYSYARPKRRFLCEDLYLPSLGGQAMGDIVIAVDCSGSIGIEELNEFAAEIKAIHQDCKPMATHILYFDSEVCHYDKFDRDTDVTIAPHGGGGTAFSPVFRYVEKLAIEPVVCVFLTDLYCNDFGPAPSYPTLYVTTGATEAPWGEIIKMRSGA